MNKIFKTGETLPNNGRDEVIRLLSGKRESRGPSVWSAETLLRTGRKLVWQLNITVFLFKRRRHIKYVTDMIFSMDASAIIQCKYNKAS